MSESNSFGWARQGRKQDQEERENALPRLRRIEPVLPISPPGVTRRRPTAITQKIDSTFQA